MRRFPLLPGVLVVAVITRLSNNAKACILQTLGLTRVQQMGTRTCIDKQYFKAQHLIKNREKSRGRGDFLKKARDEHVMLVKWRLGTRKPH
jgi:hypothetical protein